MKIAICEDTPQDLKILETLCTQILSKTDISYKLLLFSSGEDVLSCKEELDLLILDIEMQGINGIDVKEQFQRWNKKTILLFVTVHEEMMQAAFGMRVFGFIQKSNLKEQLEEILPKAVEILQSHILIDGQIDSREVVYIRAEHVYCRICLADGSERFVRNTLEYYEKMLCTKGFIRIHKSYLVNAGQVQRWCGDEVVTSVKTLPVSVRMRGKAKKQYDAYCIDHANYCGG